MIKYNNVLGWLVCGFFIVTGIAMAEDQAGDKFPLAVLPEQVYTFDPVVEGTEVVHDFILQNKGEAPLLIHNLKSG